MGNKTYTKQQVVELLEKAFNAGGLYVATENKIYKQSANFHEWIKKIF